MWQDISAVKTLHRDRDPVLFIFIFLATSSMLGTHQLLSKYLLNQGVSKE